MNRLRGVIEGVVRNRAGTPVADAAVMLGEGPDHPDIAALTDGSGNFRFADVEPGEYEVIVNAAGSAPARIRVRVDAGRVARPEITAGA
jgi:hypothetical protein